MLKDQNIICFSSIDWDFIWQGHQEIMATFAHHGNRVLFIENTGARRPAFSDIPRLFKRLVNWKKGIAGIRQEERNLFVYSPLVLPFPYSRLARRINTAIMGRSIRHWMASLHFSDAIAWVFLPTGTILSLLEKLPFKLILYYCIDDFSKSSRFARKITRTERELLKMADLVFVTSQQLYKKCIQFNSQVFSVPFGVDPKNFNLAKAESNEKPNDIAQLKEPLVGYIGGIHRWVDQTLMKELAHRHPDCSFVFVGPIQTDVKTLSQEKNIVFLGQKPKEDLPSYVGHFTACLIPYRMTPYTENVYPTKLNEYLAIGKPVISTPLPEILNFNREHGDTVEVATDVNEFSMKLSEILKYGDQKEKQRQRIEVAGRNTWPVKIEQMSQSMEEMMRKKLAQDERDWRENILLLYRTTRKNLIKAGVVLGSVYLLVFHTPLLWWIAEPLKKSDIPVKSDVIAVLGAGVGESGLAGEGYQERVQECVELYTQGYGEHVLFSSGYTYSLQEVEIMKALAIALGIPRDKILLEKRPATTYDHLVCLAETLNQHHWQSVIIVSSPYHMRRVFQVVQKVLPGYQIYLVPVRKSVYFGDCPTVKVRHIRAILHEYLALLYYVYKGFI